MSLNQLRPTNLQVILGDLLAWRCGDDTPFEFGVIAKNTIFINIQNARIFPIIH